MSNITLSNDSQRIKLKQNERLIKLYQTTKAVTIKPVGVNNLSLTQTNKTIKLAQAVMKITLKQVGLRGLRGIAGEDGAAATISIGTTTTGEAGTEAEATNVGTTGAAIIDFVIPKGDKGDQGEPGAGTDKSYVMNFTNSDFIVVNHGLSKYPSVTVINSAEDEVEGDVTYTGINSLTISFIGSFSGRVVCN